MDELLPDEWRRFQYEKVGSVVMQGPGYYCSQAVRAAQQEFGDEPLLDDILQEALKEDDIL